MRYKVNGELKTAKWNHIIELYKRAPGYKGVKLVPKLTARHVMPELINKMKVNLSTQVFSQDVGVTLGYLAGMLTLKTLIA